MSTQVIELETAGEFDIDEFLAQEARKDLLRFSTAGSVDDGKSTLIGRLLYDSRQVYEDQVRAVTGAQSIDFAQLTDGLRAEREQGITIDVAYRYFATRKRKFVIADTPGHEQYTRNMATGASTADLAIILIDARKGILIQSRRHAYIASLLGTRTLVAAINKMDLVDFSEDVYLQIAGEFRDLLREFGILDSIAIPVSALLGDNVVERSARTLWYKGPTLLEYLDSAPTGSDTAEQPLRLPVQRVIRPDQSYRGFAGQIARGSVRKGDTVVALPSGKASRVASITTFDGELERAGAPLSIALTLEDELDISRGDLLADPTRLPERATVIEASIVWFDAQELEVRRPYLVKHCAQTLPARVTRVAYRTNVQTLVQERVDSLGMNDIGVVEIELTRALFFDAYSENRATGSFILVDPQRNGTLAAGMIRRGLADGDATSLHRPRIVYFAPDAHADTWIRELEDELFGAGVPVVRVRNGSERTLRGLLSLGLVVLLEGSLEAHMQRALQAGTLPGVTAADFVSVSDLVDHLQRNTPAPGLWDSK